MARTTERVHLTLERIRRLNPPAGSQPAYVFDDDPKHLCVRVTSAGAKSFVYCGKLAGTPLRITLGSVDTWNLADARAEARRLQTLVDRGTDPRQEKLEHAARARAKRQADEAKEVTVGTAWAAYMATRAHKWGEHHRRAHEQAMSSGGEPVTRGRKKGQGDTRLPGMLHPLSQLRLCDLTATRVKAWLEECNARGPTKAALVFRMLRTFIRWCGEQEQYASIVQTDVCAGREVRDEVQAVRAKVRALQREQLPLWFEAVRSIRNPVIGAYLQTALLTGARREELLGLKWDDVDFQWKALRISDKVEGERIIPLTPFVAALLSSLPRRNRWVFSSPSASSGRLQEPLKPHTAALRAAGLPTLSIHDLRRSFASLAEWTETPVGVVAQIMGHKPSATAEKHYRRRPLDLLRLWHTKIEGWVLEQAGIAFDTNDAPGLRLVKHNTAA